MYEDNMSKYIVKDSGNRRDFGTGAVRDMGEGKGRMDLLPFFALLELAKHFEAGAVKYGDENWRKGIPLRVYLDSAIRHLFKFGLGMRDERHDLAALWNVACLIETQHMIDRGILPASLGTLPDYFNADDIPAVGEDVKALDDWLDTRFPEDPNAPPAPQESLFREIAAERQYQDGKWGTANDDRNTANDWVSYIVRYATDAAPHDFDPANFRAKMVKVAALAVAAVEAQERNGGIPPRHYDGPDAPEPLTDKGDPIPVKVRKSLGLGEYPVDLRPQDREDYALLRATAANYTRGHADETAARFNDGLPYSDDEAAGTIADHPLFAVGIIDGPDAAEYDEPDTDPLADKAWVIVQAVNGESQWFLGADGAVFFKLRPGEPCEPSRIHTRDSIRQGILAGRLRVVEAGLLE